MSLSGEGALWGRGPTANDVLQLVRDHGGESDPLVRQRLARLYAEAEVLRLIRLRTISAQVRGMEPGPEASVRKALSDEHGQHVMAMAIDLAGSAAMCSDRGPYGEADTTGWQYGYMYSRALTIGGGTSEVQRNILAEKVLGLPRERVTSRRSNPRSSRGSTRRRLNPCSAGRPTRPSASCTAIPTS